MKINLEIEVNEKDGHTIYEILSNITPKDCAKFANLAVDETDIYDSLTVFRVE